MESDRTPGSDASLEPYSLTAAEHDVTEGAPAVAKKQPKYLRRAVIAAVVGAAAIGLIQLIAPATDHQMANMGSVLVGFITAVCVAFPLHCQFRRWGHRFFVPAITVTLICLLVVLLRFDGFSGEMLPQFKYRFASSPPDLRTLSDASPASAGENSSSADAMGEAANAAGANSESLGFLGNDRTGVIDRRQFSIPADASEVETLWNQGIGQGWSSFAVSADRAVTLEQRDEMECVTCYRLSDGELLWMESHEAQHQNPLGGVGPRSTPSIVGERVYAQGATGRVWCLELVSGKVAWSVDLLEVAGWDQASSEAAIAWGRAASPLIVDGLCVLPFGGPEVNQQTGRSLIALDAETGEVRWAAGEDQISFASPGLLTLGGQRQIVIVNEKSISGHNVEDGKVLWDFEWPGQSNGAANCAMAVPVGKDRFLIGKGYGGGSALVEVKPDQAGELAAEAVWDSTRVLKTKFTHACVDGDVAYAISNGSLEAVAIAEADRLWYQPRRSRFGQGQILLVDDAIVAQAESGEVALVAADPSEYRELVRIPAMDSKTWNIPTIAGRHLLVRNDRQAICFLLPPRE